MDWKDAEQSKRCKKVTKLINKIQTWHKTYQEDARMTQKWASGFDSEQTNSQLSQNLRKNWKIQNKFLKNFSITFLSPRDLSKNPNKFSLHKSRIKRRKKKIDRNEFSLLPLLLLHSSTKKKNLLDRISLYIESTVGCH